MTITIVLKNGKSQSFPNGGEAAKWFNEQQVISQTPKRKKKKNQKEKQNDKPS